MQLSYILIIFFSAAGAICSLSNRQAISSIEPEKLAKLDESDQMRQRYWPNRNVVRPDARILITVRNGALIAVIAIFLIFILAT